MCTDEEYFILDINFASYLYDLKTFLFSSFFVSFCSLSHPYNKNSSDFNSMQLIQSLILCSHVGSYVFPAQFAMQYSSTLYHNSTR